MRYFLPILGLVATVGGLVAVKSAQISSLMKMGEAFAKAGPPPETVSTGVVRELEWEGTLSAVGTVAAARGVSVSNEAAGVVKQIRFESGDVVRFGQALVELDTSVERAQLATAQVQHQLAQRTATRTEALVSGGALTRAQLDNDNSALEAAQAQIATLKAQIERKTVRAAFAGRLGIRAVNLGQYLSPGTTVTTLEALDSVYVDFSLPQQALSSVRVGRPVRMTLDGDGRASEGTIAAVDPSLDAATRTLRVRASVPNQDERFRPGMFAQVEVVLPASESVLALPLTAVLRAPYGDSVFVVTPFKPEKPAADAAKRSDSPARQVRQQFVKLGEERGDFVAVLDGIAAGDEVVTAGAFKLRNNAKISVNNDVAQTPEVSPRPENH